MIARLCAYTRGHDRTYVCMHLCVGMIAPMYSYTCGHHPAFVLHIRVGMLGPTCAYKRMQDCAFCAYMRGHDLHVCECTRHDHVCVHIYA